MTSELTLRRPDDWHLHLRDGAVMKSVLPDSALHFSRALVMPNLVPPVVTMNDAIAYRERIVLLQPMRQESLLRSSSTPLVRRPTLTQASKMY